MTTPRENGMAPGSASGELPVWQPDTLRAEPAAPIEGAPSEEAEIGEAFVPAPPAGNKRPARLQTRARRVSANAVLFTVAAMVALGGVSFAVGRITSTEQSTTTRSAFAGANGFGFGAGASGSPGAGVAGGLTAGAAMVSGTVVSVTSDSITIQEANGRTATISTGSSTTYHNQTSATSSDVATGASVIVQTSGTGATSGSGSASASASPGTGGTRTATSVTITAS